MSEQVDISWLLAAPTPSVRYLALRRLLDRPEEDEAVQAARQEMAASGPIPAILAGQAEGGNWAGEKSYYTPKYISTHWSMLLLAELAADPADPRLRRGAAFMLDATQDELERSLAPGRHGMACFWGNLLRYVLYAGLENDLRVEWLAAYLAHDAACGWRCHINEEMPCAWGAARALWGLAALPPDWRTETFQQTIEIGLSFLLKGGRLVGGYYPTPGRVHSMWKKLNWPLFYQADTLMILRVIAELGALDYPDARPALEWLATRRTLDGRWHGVSPYRRRTWAELGDGEESDRWVSLWAAGTLRRF